MCIGIPMQVQALQPGHAQVVGRGEQRRIDTALVGPLQVGDWVLVFLDAAREVISPERAAEVNAVLDLVADSMVGDYAPDGCFGDPGFTLPSAMSAEQLQALSGATPKVSHD